MSYSPPSPPTRHPNVHQIPLDAITNTSHHNGRLEADPESVDQLASALQAQGQINPVTVRTTATGYELIAGNRRCLAARRLGWSSIAANIQDYPDDQANVIRLAENVQRSQMSPVEEANGLHGLVEANPQGVDGVAAQLGRSPNWILNRLDILSYPPELIEYVHAGLISQAAAKHLARIRNPERMAYYVNAAAQNQIDAKTASLWRQQANSEDMPEPDPSENVCQELESKIQTVTTTLCYVCKTRKDITKTLPTHVCADCHNSISTKATTTPTPPNI